MAKKELPPDRLATTDEDGHRVYLYPADVKGIYRRWRTAVYSVLMVVFLALPWLRYHDRQAFQIDLANRKLHLFGFIFWGHEAPILFFLLISFGLTLGVITALWGRVWCGWACPQTVFIDLFFRRIEKWIEGDSVQRKALDERPLDFDKAFKKAIKWMAFVALSLVITHSFLAYFVGLRELGQMIRLSPSENWGSFLFIAATTALVLYNFGWFREQFCTIICPYGRFQTVIMDQNSMTVHYDKDRNDCVNCFRCVQVCPTGIDIRRGVQLECIACTACIDACDDVMGRLKKPLGLIRYEIPQKRWFRPRVLAYCFLITAAAVGFSVAISLRKPVELEFIRSKGAPFEVLKSADNGELVINRFKLHIKNQKPDMLLISLKSKDAFVRIMPPIENITLAAGGTYDGTVTLEFPKSMIKSGRGTTEIILQHKSTRDTQEQNSDTVIEEQNTTQFIKEVSVLGPF